MGTRKMISFDWAMKRLLRNKANFEVLEGFLSELLQRKITINHIGESEGNKAEEDDKYNRVDIFVEAGNEELVIIELQFNNQYNYFQRMLYGTCKSIVEHIKEGDDYDNIRKAYSINIVYFDLGEGDDYVFHGTTNFIGLHTNNELKLNSKQRELYKGSLVSDLYPEYYIIKVNKFNDLAENTLDQWIYYLKNNAIKDDFYAQGIDKARDALLYDNLSDEEKKQYWHSVEARRIQESEIQTALIEGEAKGEARGLEKGEAIGLEKGEAIGLEKGEAIGEVKNAKKVAEKMKAAGKPFAEISEFTGLTIEEIEKL